MAFVVDASIAAAWVLPDEEAALADWALDRLGVETASVPSLFWHELRNPLLFAEQRRRIDERYAWNSMKRLRSLPIPCLGGEDEQSTMMLARLHGRTAYYASCLALAVRDNCMSVPVPGVPPFSH